MARELVERSRVRIERGRIRVAQGSSVCGVVKARKLEQHKVRIGGVLSTNNKSEKEESERGRMMLLVTATKLTLCSRPKPSIWTMSTNASKPSNRLETSATISSPLQHSSHGIQASVQFPANLLLAVRTYPTRSTRLASRIIWIQLVPMRLRQKTATSATPGAASCGVACRPSGSSWSK